MANSQRLILALGAVAAVILAVAIALLTGKKDPHPQPPPAAQSGLQVSINDQPALNTARPLRCFVNGQFVGEATLADCAKRNGVSAQALDVGVDASGAMTAAPTASLAPPPAPPPVAAPAPVEPQPAASPTEAIDQGPAAVCLQYAGGDWRPVSDSLSLNACARAMFAGKCPRPGEAVYGRWGETTLRLVPGRVEQSNDNKHFRTLTEQAGACEAGAR